MRMEPKIFAEAKKPFPAEGRILMDGLLEQFGVTREEFLLFPRGKRAGITDQVRELLDRPEVKAILDRRTEPGMSAGTAKQIREAAGVEKWNHLTEVVSYVKTLIGEKSQGEREELFSEHLAFGVDSNEIKQTLTRLNDVLPARIDTDIKHQTNLFYRAVIEVVSNALDASIKHRSPIGRFGVGFYQILNHLKDPEDKVVVTTKSAGEAAGIRLEIRNRRGQIDFKIQEDTSVPDHGTIVELDAGEFRADKAEAIVKEYFSHTQDAQLIINGQPLERWQPEGGAAAPDNPPTIDVQVRDGKLVVTDVGIGMDPRVIFEKLLVPKLSDKPPVYELRKQARVEPKIYYTEDISGKKRQCEVLIQVGGIVVERKDFESVTAAKTLVVDLPPSTILGEQRDQVEMNRDTVEAVKDTVDQALRLPKPECFAVINSLGTMCRRFQDRSKLYAREDNMYAYLQRRVREAFPETHFLPNREEFLELELDRGKVAFLDPDIYQSPIDLTPGFQKIPQWVSQENVPLLAARFKSGSTLGIIANDKFIIIDEKTEAADHPEFVNKAVELAAGWGKGRIADPAAQETGRTEREIKQFDSLENLVSEQWQAFSFASRETALRQAQAYREKNGPVADHFARLVLSGLPAAAANEAWDILHWYIYADLRETATKLAEIDQLARNAGRFLENPKVAEILRADGTPIISMFEPHRAELPRQMREGMARSGDLRNEAVVDGKAYVRLEPPGWGADSRHQRYIAADGSLVQFFGPGDLVYRDARLTVSKEQIRDTQTGEVLDLEFPLKTPWGEVARESQDKKEIFKFAPADFLMQKTERAERPEEEKPRRWEIISSRPAGEKRTQDVIYIDGQEFGRLDEIRERLGLHESVRLRDILWLDSGEPLLLFSNIYKDEGESGTHDSYILRNPESGDRIKVPEQSVFIDRSGLVVWRFNADEWSGKAVIDGSYKNRQGEDLIKRTRGFNAQCVPITYDRPIAERDPILKIVRFHFIGRTRFRETVAYVNAKGEVVRIDNTDEVNPLILDARYAFEASCPCCGAVCDSHSFFTKGYYGGGEGNPPFIGETGRSPMKSLIKLPVDITGDFRFDAAAGEWVAEARGCGQECHDLYLAVFDERGGFLRTEKIGTAPKMIHGGLDYRDQTLFLRHRLPDRLRDIDTEGKDSSYWSYEREIRSFMKVGERSIFNRRQQGSYSSSYLPALQESDNVGRNLLDVAKGELTADHLKAFEAFLLDHPVLDREKMERAAYRIMEFREVGPADLAFLLPAFYEVKYIPPGFFDTETLDLFRQVAYLDPERFVGLFEVLKDSLPDERADRLRIANKIVKFYVEKLQGESLTALKELRDELARVREYGNAVKCDGYSLIKHRVAIPPAEVPRPLRPFLTFIQREEAELAYRNLELLQLPETPARTFRLSEIIQWKRLRETESRAFGGDLENLDNSIKQATLGKNREHIVREITHAIHFQALNSTDLYVRELVQNAVDAMLAMKTKKSERQLEITASATEDYELVTTFRHPAGMDIQTVLNYFLVPGESTKLDKGQGFIGFYGQGVYTLFKNFKEIDIKTGTGTGEAWYLHITPVIENGMVSDVAIDFRSVPEDFSGIVISKTQAADNPYIEAAYVRDAVMTLTSALSDDRAAVVYQGEKINAKYKVLSEHVAGELGKVTICRNINNVVTQHGLFVRDIDSEYWGLIPDFMRRNLKNWGGIAIDLPKGVELTRSRQDIANKDKTREILNLEIQKGLVGAFLKSLAENMKTGEFRFPYDSLPYDYFAMGERYALPSYYQADIKNLLAGRPVKRLDAYVEEQDVIKLMTLLPLFKVKDQMVNLDAIRAAVVAKEKSELFAEKDWMEDLPGKLVEMIGKQSEERRRHEAMREEAEKDAIGDNTLEMVFAAAAGDLKEWMTKNWDELVRLRQLTDGFMEATNRSFRISPEGLFHFSRTDEIAHAYRRGNLSWNLHQMRQGSWQNPLESLKKYQKENKVENLLSTIDTLTHEYGHIIEGFSGWTHDARHQKEQARVLIQFIIQQGPEKLSAVLAPDKALADQPTV